MPSVRIEVGADAREVYRCANEGLSDASPLGREVVRVPAAIEVARRAVRRSLVDELGRNDFSISELYAVAPEFLIDHREFVANTDILNEVDVPLKNSRHVHSDAVGYAGLLRGFEQ